MKWALRTHRTDTRLKCVQFWEVDDLAGEVRHPEGNRRPGPKPGEIQGAPIGHLVVYPRRRRRAGAREPVDGDPLDDCSGCCRASSERPVVRGE